VDDKDSMTKQELAMTYCIGVLVESGLVMLADTRTNAGLDNIATFRKLHSFEKPGTATLAIATAGNLAVSQAVISHLRAGLSEGKDGPAMKLVDAPNMFEAAQLVGRAIRKVYSDDGPALEQHQASFEVTMLFGGQIKGGPPALYMLYKAGNFIEATPDTPFLQVGEHKYGKPILDRAVNYNTSIEDALKIALISMDSTMRSNLGVGMPLDLVVLPTDDIFWSAKLRIEPGEPYFHDLCERWSAALRKAHGDIPRPPYTRQK
jgi:putative proteasome-type protease